MIGIFAAPQSGECVTAAHRATRDGGEGARAETAAGLPGGALVRRGVRQCETACTGVQAADLRAITPPLLSHRQSASPGPGVWVGRPEASRRRATATLHHRRGTAPGWGHQHGPPPDARMPRRGSWRVRRDDRRRSLRRAAKRAGRGISEEGADGAPARASASPDIRRGGGLCRDGRRRDRPHLVPGRDDDDAGSSRTVGRGPRVPGRRPPRAPAGARQDMRRTPTSRLSQRRARSASALPRRTPEALPAAGNARRPGSHAARTAR